MPGPDPQFRGSPRRVRKWNLIVKANPTTSTGKYQPHRSLGASCLRQRELGGPGVPSPQGHSCQGLCQELLRPLPMWAGRPLMLVWLTQGSRDGSPFQSLWFSIYLQWVHLAVSVFGSFWKQSPQGEIICLGVEFYRGAGAEREQHAGKTNIPTLIYSLRTTHLQWKLRMQC